MTEKTIARINELYYTAMKMDSLFDKGIHEWQLGKNVIDELSAECHVQKFSMPLSDTYGTLMGIPIRIDLVDRDIIRLWRLIK